MLGRDVVSYIAIHGYMTVTPTKCDAITPPRVQPMESPEIRFQFKGFNILDVAAAAAPVFHAALCMTGQASRSIKY